MSEEKKPLVKQYSNDDITVVWKPDTCTHSKKCWTGLIEVFNPRNRPWIDLNGATTEKIKAQIDACPSGALSYLSKAEGFSDKMNEIEVNCTKNGQLIVFGDVLITKSDGTVEKREKRTAFCGCGASENKPFCDGSHKNIN